MAELQRKTIRVGTSYNGYARYVPIILDAVIVKQEIENNKSLVRAILRKEQVYDSNYAWSDNCTSTTQGVYQNIGKMYFDTSTIQTAEFWVQHQDNGEGSAYVSASLNTNYGSVSLSGTLNLTTIPRASKLGDIASFDIESEIPLSITKYIETWQDDLEISINETVITTKENVINGDVIKFSEDELNVIYDIMKETNSIEFNFTSSTYSINETEKKLIGSSNKNVIGNISNANPIFTNFEFVDGNELTVSLTNNNKSFIKGHSNAIISIPIKDKAIGQKGAYIKSYKAIIGDIQQSANEIEEDVVFEPINKVSSNQMIVYAIDSRGNESEKIIKYPDEFINYNDITINSIEVSREEGGISESAILEFNGTFFNETFGSTGIQNEIKGFYLYNNNSSSDSIEYTELELTIEDNKYSFSGKIKGDLDAFGFNVENEYVISIKIVDLLNKEGKTDSDLLLSGTPNMALADTGQVAFGGICDLDSEFQAQFKKAVNFENGIYENGKRLGGEALPIGSMIPFGSDKNIPSNWRICDGSEVSRTTYADLFKVIGTTYGEGDGETTFNLPDKRGRVSVGLDEVQDEFNTIGKKGGSKHLQAHKHNVLDGSYSTPPNVFGYNDASGYNVPSIKGIHSNGTGGKLITDTVGTGDSGNLQPYEIDVWIIKVSNLVSSLEETTGSIIDNLTSTSTTDALSANMGRELNEKINNIAFIDEYSTEEQRIGTWIDGKPIYRKTLSMGSISGSAVYSHGIDNLHRVVHAFGTFLQSSGHMEPLPKVVVNNAAWSADFADFTSTTFVLNFGSNIGTATEVTLTIEYTKTTD